jgi:quinol monooxygenase YgiN
VHTAPRMARATPDAVPPGPMYGLIGQMTAQPGQRHALQALLVEHLGEMPGCRSYVVALDQADDDGLWVTEVWDDQASHAASLTLPAVQQLIARARPLIAGSGARIVTTPVGGIGLQARLPPADPT